MSDHQPARISAVGIEVAAGAHKLVRNIDFAFSSGEMVAILGPNGAGKTTLLRALLGLQRCSRGDVTLNNTPIRRVPSKLRAQQVAYLPQERPMAWPNRVKDVVALGRFAHGVALNNLADTDTAAVNRAITACDLQDFVERTTDTLSGGELARVHCARAYATEAPLLIADEPIAGLDPLHQHAIMNLLRDYVAQCRGVLVVLHDINLALRYADRLVWMQGGQIIASEPPAAVTSERILQIYGLAAHMHSVPHTHVPQVLLSPGDADEETTRG